MLQPQRHTEIPEMTQLVAKTAFPKGSLFMTLRIDWKYGLGLELTDPGFDYSVLSEFRQRLVSGGAESMLLDALLEQCEVKGLRGGKKKQRTDSTHILAAVRSLTWTELVGETMRRALESIARVAPE